MKEIWKSIPGFNEKYSASNTGKIRKNTCVIHSQRNSIPYKMTSKEFTMSQSTSKKGYKALRLTAPDGRRYGYMVHRLVMLAFNGSSDLQVNHIDGVKDNNSLKNLEYCTQSQNMRHRIDILKYKHPSGMDNHRTKFSLFEYREANRLRRAGWTVAIVASWIGCSESLASKLGPTKYWDNHFANKNRLSNE